MLSPYFNADRKKKEKKMKKLIVMLAVVCVAVVSQAAAVSWTASAASAYNGQTMYMLTSIAQTYDSLKKFENSAVDSAVVTKIGPNYKISGHIAKNDAITSTASLYLAIVDGNTIHYLDVTDTFQPYVYEPPASSPGDATAVFADVANSTTTATIGDPTPTPEPTSGILLIFGMAGLALRRRRV